MVHYDTLTRPSEVHDESISLWVQFLDMPLSMMKECFAKKLGGQLGKYVKMDTRYPGYLRVRLEYPLKKALQPSLTMKIKGRRAMAIALRYENIPHFCYHCGCMGHVAINFEEGEGLREVTGGGVNESLIKFFCKNRPMSQVQSPMPKP
jgi:hypothetical protein